MDCALGRAIDAVTDGQLASSPQLIVTVNPHSQSSQFGWTCELYEKTINTHKP